MLALWLTLVAPPPALPIDGLADDDPAVWRRAADDLWHAGGRAVPALKAMLKGHPDPDAKLRAALVLSRLAWGIRPETPAAIVALIERYRDGDAAQKRDAVSRLLKEGAAGYSALRLVLAREGDPAMKAAVAAELKALVRPAVRDHLARGELAEAETVLETAARTGDDAALRDWAAFLAVLGRPDRGDDPKRAAFVLRAAGDLKGARAAAEQLGEAVLLAAILAECEDYAILAGQPVPTRNEATWRFAVLHRAGKKAEAEAALSSIDPRRGWSKGYLLLDNGRPREGIAELAKEAPQTAAQLLALQGRLKEALAMPVPTGRNQAVRVLLEQAVAAHRLGEEARRDKLLAQADETMSNGEGAPDASLLAARLEAGKAMGRKPEALDAMGKLLDSLKPDDRNAQFFLREIATADAAHLALWWQALRARRPDAPRSALLKMLDGWFGDRKEGEGFDAALKDAEAWAPPPAHLAYWRTARALACERVGRHKEAEALLQG
ncbi:MAG: hypothetical protein K2W96_06575, partial [Gemmataceae bacterium]|nr:hypothetical protein [Gemmataceae bacterium]